MNHLRKQTNVHVENDTDITTFTVQEHEGLHTNLLTFVIRVLTKPLDVSMALKRAVEEFSETPDFKDLHESNGNSFNWGDIPDTLPEAICRSHGFQIIQTNTQYDEVDWNEQLITDRR